MAMMKKVKVEAKLGEKFKVQSKIRDHVVYIDQPTATGGDDTGPTPLEYVLFSLAGCFASIARIMASQRKINLRSMHITTEGQLDMDTLLGKSQENRAGFSAIKITAKIDADISQQEKEEFLHEVDLRCPISDNLKNVTEVTHQLLE